MPDTPGPVFTPERQAETRRVLRTIRVKLPHRRMTESLLRCTRMTGGRQVLIVDDNLALAENIAEILQLDGHIARVAGSAEELFSNAWEDELDVVVTDYRLPG